MLPERDVRRKRPAMLSFLLRLETLRRVARVLSLLVLDFIGVTAALYTAIMVKLLFRGDFDLSVRLERDPPLDRRSPTWSPC